MVPNVEISAFDIEEPAAAKMPSEHSLLSPWSPYSRLSMLLGAQGKPGNSCVPQSSKYRDVHGGK